MGLGLLSRKYFLLEAGAVKMQNEQGEHQSGRHQFLDGPKDTIQVRQIRIASRRKIGLGGVGTTERKPKRRGRGRQVATKVRNSAKLSLKQLRNGISL